LILEGELDQVARKPVRDRLRDLSPRAETHVFAGAGHALMITHLQEWSEVVVKFLTS